MWTFRNELPKSYCAKACATIFACCNLSTLMYFKKLASVVCPVIAIMLILGTPLKYIFVAKLRLACMVHQELVFFASLDYTLSTLDTT